MPGLEPVPRSTDAGFRLFKLAASNIRAWEPDREDLPGTLVASIEHLKTDRTEQDILFELLLKLGLDLTVPIERRTSPARLSIVSAQALSLLVLLSILAPMKWSRWRWGLRDGTGIWPPLARRL